MSDVNVTVVEFSDRRCYQMQWRDPITRRKKTKSSGVERTGKKRELREAERKAGILQKELCEGTYKHRNKITWAEFRERYEAEELSGLTDGTFKKVGTVFSKVEEVLKPSRLSELNKAAIGKLKASMRRDELAEATIDGNLAHLRSALAWAVEQEMLTSLPFSKRRKKAKSSSVAKGRALSLEEFELMTLSVGKVIPDESRQPEWKRYLEGLWLSGLRLAESLDLYWGELGKLRVCFDGKHPMLIIPGELQKSGRDEILPITPDFAEFLTKTPKSQRRGRVFKPLGRHGKVPCHYRVSEIVGDFGQMAGIKVSVKKGKTKFASAHDLRRSFGERWAHKVPSQVLQKIMRHSSITTTLKYYASVDAERIASNLWAASPESQPTSNTLSNSAATEEKEAAG